MGRVDDIEPAYERAAVVAVPVLEGGGTRLKIVDAWQHGKAVITTSKGIEGLDAPVDCAAICDSPADFAHGLEALLTNPVRRLRIGTAGQNYMRERLSHTHIRSLLGSRSLLAASIDALCVKSS